MTATRIGRSIPLPVLPASPSEGAAPLPGRRSAVGGVARIAVVTLGCDKNTVDSERVMAGLLGAGAELVRDPAGADVVVINTCGFIDMAKEESVEAVLDAGRLKAEGRVKAVVAMGCLVQRYKAELTAEMPEVDLFLGLTEIGRLVPELRERGLLAGREVPVMERPLRALSTDARHSAFLKISEGCDHTCAFCAIPLMRGKFRSTPMDVLVAEAAELEQQGVVELNVVSQDTTWYGRDWRRGIVEDTGEYFFGRGAEAPSGNVPAPGTTGRTRAPADVPATGALPLLLDRLLDETEIPWLRLFYMYPSGISDALVERIASSPRILPYLDMPIQHGSDAVLRRMRRPERAATIRERVGRLRGAIPDLTLRTTVIVGFPGETEDDFDRLLALLEEIRFDHVGAFAYSPEEGTRAVDLPGRVNEVVCRERVERLQDLQRAITLERNEAWIGRQTTVLVDAWTKGERGDEALGRTAGQAPEVDGTVRLEGAGGLRPGELVPVRIMDATEDGLEGTVVEAERT